MLESDVENAALQWFEAIGWATIHGTDLAPGEPTAERASCRAPGHGRDHDREDPSPGGAYRRRPGASPPSVCYDTFPPAAPCPDQEPRNVEAPRNPAEQDAIDALLRCRRALTASEIALFRSVVFPELSALHYEGISKVLSRRGVREADREDVLQELLETFFFKVVAEGFPDDLRAKLHADAAGRVANQRRGEAREPWSLGLPSSGSELPISTPHLEHRLDVEEAVRRIVPALSQEHLDMLPVILDEATDQEVADKLGIPRRTVTSRAQAAKKQLAEMAKAFLPDSQRS